MLILIAVIAGSSFAYFQPKPVIQDPSEASIGRVSYHGIEVSQFKQSGIIEVLSEYQYKRSFQKFSPYYDYGKIEIEIDGLASQNPLHIVVGENVSIYYVAANRTICRIIDPNKELEGKIMEFLTVKQ